MHVVGWILWILAALWGLIELRLFLHTCFGKSFRDLAYPHEWKQTLFSSGFSLLLTTCGLFLTVFFDFSKLHLLWIVTLGFFGGTFLSERLFPDPSHKIHREGIERIQRMIQDRSD